MDFEKFAKSAIKAAEKKVYEAQDNYDKGYEKAQKLNDSQIRNKVTKSDMNVYEKQGMAQAFKDRHGID